MSKAHDWKDEERQKIDVLEVWKQVQRTIANEKKEKIVTRNSRWKTIRIFVSSTFKDFHTERDVLVKEVFPDLRQWCQRRDLNLVECDLRWGVPQETPYCVTLEICLEEIRRCERENTWPYFLNMTSKRIGFIPLKDELPDELINKFDLVLGLSIAEMEIVEAAYRKGNPNSLFMYRDESFIESITDEKIRKEFVDELNPIANKKLKILKEKIEARFSVLEFFKKRIDEDYPLANNERMNKMDEDLNQHDAFMQSRANLVLGRQDTLKKIMTYLESDRQSQSMILVGDSGSGKSSIMAKLVYDLLDKIK
ncbi:hypothetical protein HELRODRAFT_171053 [Helobdella robusta]|uniref:Uncharacterized protein n=1 Tax=Helobdella robusta TaxID=6412 RepID=T1F3R5_HELRO|nr:hypothetical protein HELRODRAFT_171053 [Helobdella robusta]ESO07015.1 hypothetical protein HELRODRAFT_171053 [Helobdella robusta]